LVVHAVVTPERIRNARALQHLKEGFNRRVLMLDAGLHFIDETVSLQGGEPLSVYVATDLAIHLNAFYLNLCGALDNLAWALQYEHQLFPGVGETSLKRQRVNLFNNKFLDALDAVAATVATGIRHHLQWNSDLRNLRDPAAHRIPIYAVPGVVTGQQRNEFQHLQKNAADLFTAGDLHGGWGLVHQSTRIGAYQPLMVLSHERGLESRDIRIQVQDDEQHFVEVAEAVLRHLFAPPPA
jgi:hypothetical protein